MDVKQLRELMRAFDEAGASELILESDSEKVILRKGMPGSTGPVVAATAGLPQLEQIPTAPRDPAPGAAEAVSNKRLHTITSPMVATFYRAPAPGAAPFVSVGDRVSQGQVLCILECMKVMNHMESEVSGRLKEILVENAEGVEYGQPLFVIEVDD